MIEQKVFDLLEASGLNYHVDKVPLVAENPMYSRDTSSYGLFRNDTGGHLHTVGETYTILQNSELCELMLDAAHTIGLGDKVRAGELKEGRKIYVQFDLGDMIVASDTLKRHVTALNVHGAGSVGFGSSNTVVVCQNTFYKAMRDAEFKFRHSSNVKANLEDAISGLLLSISMDEQLMDSFKRMANAQIEEHHIVKTVSELFGLNIDTPAEMASLVKGENVSTRKFNAMELFSGVMKDELKSHGNTVWGLFNAVTYYTNHVLPKESDTLDYIMSGAGSKINSNVYQLLAESLN